MVWNQRRIMAAIIGALFGVAVMEFTVGATAAQFRAVALFVVVVAGIGLCSGMAVLLIGGDHD